MKVEHITRGSGESNFVVCLLLFNTVDWSPVSEPVFGPSQGHDGSHARAVYMWHVCSLLLSGSPRKEDLARRQGRRRRHTAGYDGQSGSAAYVLALLL